MPHSSRVASIHHRNWTLTLQPDGRLTLRENAAHLPVGNPRRPADAINFDNLILDHGHLMHFFMLRMPEMDSFWHLHPSPAGNGTFAHDLPPIPPGHYELFADVVLSNGFPVTMVGQLDVPAYSGKALSGDDSGILTTPISQDEQTSQKDAKDSTIYSFPDGGRMIWQRDPGPLKANVPLSFQFLVQDQDGKPAHTLEPYMGMAAHAEIIRSDASVFAHVHPAGSVAMAALDLAQMQTPGSAQAAQAEGMSSSMLAANMPGMNMPGMSSTVDPAISFPYGFPKPGFYRIFVQIKRAGHVETAVFGAAVN